MKNRASLCTVADEDGVFHETIRHVIHAARLVAAERRVLAWMT
jgi:hypothetical protein